MKFLLIVALFSVLFLLSDFVIYRTFIRRINSSVEMKRIWILQAILLILIEPALLIAVHEEWLTTDSILFMGGVFIFLSVGIAKILYLLYSIPFIFPFYRFRRLRYISAFIGAFLSVSLFGIILYGGIWGRKKIVVTEKVIQSEKLPAAFNGYRIVQFSDFHLGSVAHNPRYIEDVIQTINALHPDLIVFTGDLVNSRQIEAVPFQEILSQLKATDGVYSILGNHDYGYYFPWKKDSDRQQNLKDLIELQRKAGWQLLNNEHTLISRGNDKIALIGIENWSRRHFGQQGDLTKATKGLLPNLYSILLSHNPESWEAIVLSKTSIDLTLSGHTHAMQIKIGQFSPSEWVYKQWNGLYQKNSQYLYVNRGVGFVVFPARIGAYPEITFIELRNK